LQLQGLLEKFGLIHHVLVFVKVEGKNLQSMVMNLQSLVDYKTLKILQVYEGTCFGHVMSKICEYGTNDDKVSIKLTFVSVKDSQVALQKIITWTKNSAKRKQEWEKACMDSGLWLYKLKTPIKTRFASKVIMVEETLEFKVTILLCYGKQKTLVCSNKSQRPKCGPL
jgi:hypothetical protein